MNIVNHRGHVMGLVASVCLAACAAPTPSGTDDPQANDVRESAPSTSERAHDSEGAQSKLDNGLAVFDKAAHGDGTDGVVSSREVVRKIGNVGSEIVPFGTTQFWDSFEGSTPWTRWEGGQSGNGVVGYDVNAGGAYSGLNNGWLKAGNGSASNRIPVSLSGFSIRNNCAVGVKARALGTGGFVGLQVWNPSGWSVIAATYPWINGNGAGYQQISISGLNLTSLSGTIYLQAIYSNSSGVQQFVRIDDMVLECYW